MIVFFALALVAVIVYVMYRGFSKKSSSGITGGVSAFAKIADAELKQKEAEGKIIAVKAAAEVKRVAAEGLKDAALAAHASLDDAHKAFDEVHEILG